MSAHRADFRQLGKIKNEEADCLQKTKDDRREKADLALAQFACLKIKLLLKN